MKNTVIIVAVIIAIAAICIAFIASGQAWLALIVLSIVAYLIFKMAKK